MTIWFCLHIDGKRTRITAVHFNGDSSHMIVGRHHNYLGNGKVKLNKNEYINWQQAEWVNQLGMDKFFNIDNTSGVLLIKDSGIFMIYAQVSMRSAVFLNASVSYWLDIYNCRFFIVTNTTLMAMKFISTIEPIISVPQWLILHRE